MMERPKILVVEDEQSVAAIMAHLQVRAGCDAEVVLNVHHAMRLAQQGGYDLITLDVNMPGMSGFEMCRRLKEMPHLQQTLVIFVSGHASEDHVRRGLDAGAVDYIPKPFLPTEFVSRVMSQIRRAADSSKLPGGEMDADCERA